MATFYQKQHEVRIFLQNCNKIQQATLGKLTTKEHGVKQSGTKAGEWAHGKADNTPGFLQFTLCSLRRWKLPKVSCNIVTMNF